MNIAQIDIKEVTRQAAELIAIMSLPDVMWTADNCATYLGVGKRHFAERMCKHPTFPPAIQFPSDELRPVLKWKAEDVKNWAYSSSKSSRAG